MKFRSPNFVVLLAWLAILIINPCFSAAHAQGITAFTYQGQLRDNGTNANGTYTMTFKLYDSSSGGNQIGNTITSSTALANGLFTVNLDFGASAFNGAARWLDITVQSGSDSEELTPRVQVLPTPYAQFAALAATVTNGAIMNAQLAVHAVATTNIQNGAISNAQLAVNSVMDVNIVSVSGTKVFGTVGFATNADFLDGLDSSNFALVDDLTNYATYDDLTNYITFNELMADNEDISNEVSDAIPDMQVFNEPGTFQFTVPTNVDRLTVEVWGGGGGGGTGNYTAYSGGAGGGAGGYGKESFNVEPGAKFTIIVGAGGGSDTAGEDSSFGDLVSANGGGPGNENVDPNGLGGGGIGGTCDASFNITGGSGVPILQITSGGDGGNAGSGGSGGRGDAEDGAEPGQAPGGGGGGGAFIGTNDPGTGNPGAEGGDGRVVVYY